MQHNDKPRKLRGDLKCCSIFCSKHNLIFVNSIAFSEPLSCVVINCNN